MYGTSPRNYALRGTFAHTCLATNTVFANVGEFHFAECVFDEVALAAACKHVAGITNSASNSSGARRSTPERRTAEDKDKAPASQPVSL
jgi:hypothetical protein